MLNLSETVAEMTETWLGTIGVSQPTVSRLIRKLESEGVIREYTMIPDFSKLGYQILGLTFVKLKETLNPGKLKRYGKSPNKE